MGKLKVALQANNKGKEVELSDYLWSVYVAERNQKV